MPDARDIINKFPRPDAAASTKICAFRETFGTSLIIVSKVWSMLWEEDVLPEGGHPKHFFGLFIFSRFTPCRPRDARRRPKDTPQVLLVVDAGFSSLPRLAPFDTLIIDEGGESCRWASDDDARSRRSFSSFCRCPPLSPPRGALR
jgi:hypothetical protein